MTVRVLEKEKAAMSERIFILEKDVRRYVDIVRERETTIHFITREVEDLRELSLQTDDLRERLKERDLQIIEIITDSNYRQDIIDALEGKLDCHERSVVEISRRLELKEEKLQHALKQAKKVPESSELRRYRTKYEIPKAISDTRDELFRIYRALEDYRQECEFIKKQMLMAATPE